jgi:YVTN family beta-propeller protein
MRYFNRRFSRIMTRFDMAMRFLLGTTLSLLTLSLMSVCAQSAAPTPTPSTRLLNRQGIVYSQRTDKIYIVNEGKNAVSVILRDGTVTEVKVGSHPQALAVSEATGKVYVANSEETSISILDGATDKVITTVPLHTRPYVIAIDQKAHIVYVPGSSIAIDDNTNAVIPDSMHDTDAILVDEKRRQFVIMGYEGDSITLFNLDNHSSKKLDTGGIHLWGLAQFDDTIFVTHVQDASMAAINLNTGKLEEIPTGAMPCAVAIDAKAGEIYVANYWGGSVTVVNLRDHHVTATISVGGRPQAVNVDPDKHLVYVADTLHKTVTAFDAHSRRVVDTFKIEESPYALFIDKPTHIVYAATLGDKGFIRLHTKH